MPTAQDRRRFATLEDHLSLPLVGHYGKKLIGLFRDLGWRNNRPMFVINKKKPRQQVILAYAPHAQNGLHQCPCTPRVWIQNPGGCPD